MEEKTFDDILDGIRQEADRKAQQGAAEKEFRQQGEIGLQCGGGAAEEHLADDKNGRRTDGKRQCIGDEELLPWDPVGEQSGGQCDQDENDG